jgi:hypothetical protein
MQHHGKTTYVISRTIRFVLCTLIFTILAPHAAVASLSPQEATRLLLAWMKAATPEISEKKCLAVTSSVFRNGGYTSTIDAAGCKTMTPEKRRWRIDAYTTEVFVENDQGKFVVPTTTKENGPLVNVAFALGKADLLPKKAKIIEYASLAPTVPDRAYVLWMLAPERVAHDKGESYTCPDRSRGSYWSGPTRLSLIDTRNAVLLSTIPISDPMGEADSFDLPYSIPASQGFPYVVPEGSGEDKEGRPALLHLRDYNGDGKPLEFYLASADNCMLMLYAVFGYDPGKDAAVQYSVHLTSDESGKKNQETTSWINFWPLQTGMQKGRYAWDVDFRGRAGCLERYAVEYNGARQRFEGTLTLSDCQQ